MLSEARASVEFLVSLLVPARGSFDITPDDGNDLSSVARGIYVGTLGDLHVLMQDGSDVTYVALLGGVIHPMRVVRVFSTGTTADDILGMR